MRGRSLVPAVLTLAKLIDPTCAWANTLIGAFNDANKGAQHPAVSDVISPEITAIQETAARGTDFPVTATTPGFTYTYNPDLDLYERSSVSLGPAFLERAETLGKGRFDLGVAYLYANFTDLNGNPLQSNTPSGSLIATTAGIPIVEPISFPKFTLISNAVYFSGSYGLTDRWDVNVLMPLFSTTFHVREIFPSQSTGANVSVSVNGYKVGPGDLQLRTKYRVLERDGFRLAPGFSLILPTGEKGNFQGLGDTRLEPSVVGSFATGRLDLHSSLGFEVNADNVDRSRVRYGVGGSYGILERLTGLVDVIGSSAFTSQDVLVVSNAVQSLVGATGVKQVQNANGRFDIFEVIDRTDIVDLSVGIKVNPFGNFVAFASAILPITSDGVRADVIPAVGISYSH